MRIDRVIFNGKTFELAIPVYLSDDEMHFADKVYNSERAAAAADAVFVFNIIQKQIEELMVKMEKNETDLVDII